MAGADPRCRLPQWSQAMGATIARQRPSRRRTGLALAGVALRRLAGVDPGLDARPPDENPPERGADTLDRPTVTPDLALTAEPAPVPRDMPLTASTRDGTEIVRAAAGRGELDSTEPL